MNHHKISFATIEQLLEMRENGQNFTVVDVLSADSYAQGHIPEALSLPADQIEEKAAEVLPDKDATIVTYCARYMCRASTNAARKLQEMGYKHVLDYKAGLKGWQMADMPLAKS
jgi:rhodanese-related sulfurtransferase